MLTWQVLLFLHQPFTAAYLARNTIHMQKRQELTPEERQSALQRNRTILLATLDYLEERFGGSFVLDQHDPATEHYQQEKSRVENYFRQGRLDRLEQRLRTLTKGLQRSVDLNFAAYIKEKTGYDIDPFEVLRHNVAAIVERHEIRSQSELNDIGTMLHYYQKTAADGAATEQLKLLLADYPKRPSRTSRRSEGEHAKMPSKAGSDGREAVMVSFSTGAKHGHYEAQWAPSPDGKRRLRVAQFGDGDQASTYVAIHFENGSSGAVYSTTGICPHVKAWWKNNATIIIETSKACTAHEQHQHVRSFEDAISIEYIER